MSEKDIERRAALDDAHIDTLAIRAGQVRTGEGEHAEPIYPTSSYVFDSAEQAAERFRANRQAMSTRVIPTPQYATLSSVLPRWKAAKRRWPPPLVWLQF